MPSTHRYRVLFVVRPGPTEAACTRYRGYNVMEALRLAGVETQHLDDQKIFERLDELRLFDLVVLVRRRMSPEIARLLEFADECSIPVVCDLDDYIFDEEVIPESDYLRAMPLDQARGLIHEFRELVLRATYYTGATDTLTCKAAALGKTSFCIPNGFNLAQLELSHRAIEEVRRCRDRSEIRIGYFSGTLTHQSDFRMIAPVLVSLLEEFANLKLTVAGDFDLAQFAEFSRFAERVEKRPFVDWTRLPAELARVDINLIPLVINAFTEGKSDLKYYEAALVEVPSVASPTVVYQSCIERGVNGLLAQTEDDWYRALRTLIVDPDLRERMGKEAHEHAVQHYAPAIIASKALSAYRGMIIDHRKRQGIDPSIATATVLAADLSGNTFSRQSILKLCAGLAEAGVPTTLQILAGCDPRRAADLRSRVSEDLGFEPEFAIQVSDEIACCDFLMATDYLSAGRAWNDRHRARWAAYLVSEYEPAKRTTADVRARTERSFRLGLDLLTLDPLLRDRLDPEGQLPVTVLPGWLDNAPVDFDSYPTPCGVLVIGTDKTDKLIWEQASSALLRVTEDHPDLPIWVWGEPTAASWSRKKPFVRAVSRAKAAPESLLRDRPICLVLGPTDRFPRPLDLIARGAPVITVSRCSNPCDASSEFERAVIDVPADASLIAQAMDALLIDPVRCSALALRAADYLRRMPRPVDTARALLRAYRGDSHEELKLHDCGDGTASGGPVSQVA
ncbi:MAG: glycosyltransferase [Isosphaeraceae bacterium]